MTPDRHTSLDALRGIAVMGILLMNITAFSMPEAAYMNPRAWGYQSAADLWAWAANFLLVESKMRGLFSILFGASMLLVYERAEAASGNGGQVHRRRMVWLLLFGLVHYYLVWSGDILTLYAVCGLIGIGLLLLDEKRLLRVAILLFAINFVFFLILISTFYTEYQAGQTPGATAEQLKDYRALLDEFGSSGPAAMASEVAVFRGGYWGIVVHRFVEDWSGPLELMLIYGAETLGLMALGMLLFRNGFLTGTWDNVRYRRFAVRAYTIGLIPLAGLLAWCFVTGLDVMAIVAVTIAFAMPFRIAVTLGHAALAMILIKRFAGSALMARIAATGRAAFTNYLGTSILMTGLFYGWGFGLFGHVSRWQAFVLCLPVWVLMLAWSKPWLDRFRYGPFEWAWRSLARGTFEKMHRQPISYCDALATILASESQ